MQDDNVALAEDLLHGCPSERRGWEWHYVKRLCHPERLSMEVPAGSLSAIAFSPDGRVIATGSGGQFSRGKGASNLEFWDRETGQRRPIFHVTENVIWGLAFSPDGTKLALGGTNPQVEVRDAHTGALLWSKHEPKLPQAMSIAFRPDGKALAVGFGLYSQQEAFQVKIYELETGRETVAFPAPKGGVNDLAFHPDGRHLAVAGAQVVEVWDVYAPQKVHTLGGHAKWVYGVAYSPDGKWLATGGWDRTIKLRYATTGEEELTIFAHDGFVLDLAFSPDSRSLVSTSEDRSVRLWEVPSGRPVGVLHGHTDFVQAVAFAPDGRELASGGMEGTLKVWDRRSSFPIVFDGHTGWVGRLWYRRDGRRVVTAPIAHQVAGETTKSWDPSTGELDPALTAIAPSKLRDEYLPPIEFPANFGPPRGDEPRWQADRPCLGRLGRSANGRSQQGVREQLGRSPRREERPCPPHADRPHGGSARSRLQSRRPADRHLELGPDHQALGPGHRPRGLYHSRSHRRAAGCGFQSRRPPAGFRQHRLHCPRLGCNSAAGRNPADAGCALSA